jgi:uncharacterized protein (TIGR03435 family)
MASRLLIVAVVLWATVAPDAQTSAPTFDVASVKLNPPGIPGGRVRFLPGGRFVGENVPLYFLVQQVYGIRDFQLIAAPQVMAVLKDGRYQVEGKGREDASEAQLKEMVKALLAERFGLRLHKETRNLPVYALVPDPGGVKGARAAGEKPAGGISLVDRGWIRGQGVTFTFLAEALSGYVDRPVVDRTKLDQVLDFNLTWTPNEIAASPDAVPGCPLSFAEMAKRFKVSVPTSCPSIFTALREQLGLRLDAQQAPLDALVIDAVHPPTEN